MAHELSEAYGGNQGDQPKPWTPEESIHLHTYKPSEAEVLTCSLCTQSGDIFTWYVDPTNPTVPSTVGCESLSDLLEEAKGTRNSFAVGYSTRPYGCFFDVGLQLFWLQEKGKIVYIYLSFFWLVGRNPMMNSRMFLLIIFLYFIFQMSL